MRIGEHEALRGKLLDRGKAHACFGAVDAKVADADVIEQDQQHVRAIRGLERRRACQHTREKREKTRARAEQRKLRAIVHGHLPCPGRATHLPCVETPLAKNEPPSGRGRAVPKASRVPTLPKGKRWNANAGKSGVVG